ncbi:MAG: F0F1 ATP synthase subunit epsilon [Wolbachia sp.]|nr:F0F1 ATP synthase subunit epsilon [Wolbachia sp.]MDD9336036.1 F0F1 ATP synthase subunit epsilon [Wolbachia sp.]
MNTFKVQFFSPNDQISFNEVFSLSVNGLEGDLVILADHAPYLIYLLPAVVTVKVNNQKEEKIVIDNGVLEVANNNCNIITNHIQVFDRLIHDEKSFKNKRINIHFGYLDSINQ